MKIFTIGLILAAFTSYAPFVNAQAAKDCEDLRDSYLELYPEFTPTCECIAGSDNITYTLSCQDGCETCDKNENCGLRSFTQGIDSQGGFFESRDCFEFTTGSFDDNVICIGQEVEGCIISVNDEDCSSCEYQLKECGMKGEGSFLYANCTNVDEIDTIVDECSNTGFDGILLPYFTAYYPSETCGGEPGESEAAQYCEDSRQFFLASYAEFMPTCECIPGEIGAYTLSCEDNCESCDEAEDCGIRSYTEVIDPYSFDLEYRDCFEHLQGDFKGDKVCYGTSFSGDGTQKCSISMNDEDCKSCEYVYQSCGLSGESLFLVADCTNVDEIGVVVDECQNTGFDGALSSFFSSYDLGMCSTNSTGNATEPPEQGAEEYCIGEMEFYESFPEFETSCECIAGSDNITYTLSCQDGCEICDPVTKVCGINSFSELIDPQRGAYEYRNCIAHTQGSFEGNEVCIENSYSGATEDCGISVNEMDCASCEYVDKVCRGVQGYFLVANCTNVNEIGVVVDQCFGTGLGEDEILSILFSEIEVEVGTCNITDQPTEPPDQTTEPPVATSGTSRESQMTLSCIVVAAVLFTSLAY